MRLGVDTGGTYTDAAVLDAQGAVVASAKARTTHHNLVDGVAEAIDRVLQAFEERGGARSEITSVALSTTLATNAMVEGVGGGAALILVGFDSAAAQRVDGLERAAVVERLAGGHTAQGREATPLDEDGLAGLLDRLAACDSVAVASLFAVRNDAHEQRVRAVLASDARTAHLPVTCSHELSGRLDGPRRAATALANAVLTTPVQRLITAFEDSVRRAGLDAPVVVVRSDGSVMSLKHAAERPVETILSGPAASLIGGMHLAGIPNGVVIDIGGTTTDVALVSDGIPEVVDDGAIVGGVATMIRSPRITTEGLGGDSEVGWDETGCRLTLGPVRVTPIGVAAVDHPQITGLLEAQLARRIVTDTDGLFFLDSEGRMLEATSAFRTRRDYLAARRRTREGDLTLVALTPTDAAWATGRVDGVTYDGPFNVDASKAALQLFAETLNRFGEHRFGSGDEAAEQILTKVQHLTGAVVASATGIPSEVWNHRLASHPHFKVGIELDRPVVGIGASAQLHHPPLAELLGCEVIIPRHSEVANAVGAAVGSVRMQLTAVITSPKRAGFVLHRPGPTVAFETLDEAVAEAEDRLRTQLLDRQRSSGLAVDDPQIAVERHDKAVTIEGTDFFVECRLDATLTHRL